MKRQAVLAPLAAAAALALSGLTTAQAQEATEWEIPPPSRALTRAQVMAELQEWRMAGAHHPGNEAGPSDAVLERRMALNRLAEERHARAMELEQQRLAAEAAARATPAGTMAQAPGTPAQTEGVAAQGQGQEPAMATPVDAAPTAEGSPMAPTDDPVPSPAPAADAITDTNRERMSVEPATGTLPAAEGDASPQDRDAVPLETEPAPPTVPSESPAEGRPPVAEVPADAQGQPADASPLPGGSPSSNPEPDGGAATAEPTRPPSNAYGYREPQDKYPPPESEPAPEEAKPHPVQ